jgi:PhoPQ-activated pathogenicity-related protein
MFGGKREDQLVAMSFDRYLVTGDAQWPLLLPMVKSAVRAMDAVQDFADEEWSMKLKTFTIAGASKRGWTTWLTGAVDRRVTALVPMVIDMLKIEAQLKHQNDVWGDVSRRIGDYTRLDLPKRLNSDAGRKLQSIVDPIHYRDRLTQPKVILIGTNDHFWPLDALNLYWEDLVGPKYIVYVPNNRHGITDIARLTGSLIAVHRHTVTGRPLPELSWNFTDGDAEVSLRVTSQPLPQRVNSWSASSPTRDFREARWSSQPAKADGKDYVRTLRRPESGWSALFGEAVYAGSVAPFYLSTNVKIVGAQDIDSEVPQALNGE